MKKTLQIRHYIMGLMYRAGNSSVKIMSARNLAKHFDVACSTVALALKELTDEGYIFSRPGVGNFTNPLRMPVYLNREMPPLIGLMSGDGRFYFMGDKFWMTYRALGDAVFEAGYNLRNIELDGPVNEHSVDEILNNRIDGLLWVGAYNQKEFAERLRDAGLPVVSDSSFMKNINAVVPDKSESISMLLAHCASVEKHEVLFYLPPEISRVEEKLLVEQARKQNYPIKTKSIDPTLFPQEKLLEGYFKKHCNSVAVLDARRHAPDFLPVYAANADAQVELYEHEKGMLNGEPVSFFKGARFAQAMVERLTQLLAGDKTVRHVSAPLESRVASPAFSS